MNNPVLLMMFLPFLLLFLTVSNANGTMLKDLLPKTITLPTFLSEQRIQEIKAAAGGNSAYRKEWVQYAMRTPETHPPELIEQLQGIRAIRKVVEESKLLAPGAENIAVMDLYSHGSWVDRIGAVSGRTDVPLSEIVPQLQDATSQQRFGLPTTKAQGRHGITDRDLDSEIKIFREMLSAKPGTYEHVDQLRLISERPMCSSCIGSSDDFLNKFNTKQGTHIQHIEVVAPPRFSEGNPFPSKL